MEHGAHIRWDHASGRIIISYMKRSFCSLLYVIYFHVMYQLQRKDTDTIIAQLSWILISKRKTRNMPRLFQDHSMVLC